MKKNSDNTAISVPKNQTHPSRAPHMAELFRQTFGLKPIKAMEVGVWYGLGSTNIWLENIAPDSQIFLVDSWAPYASQEDLDDAGWDYKAMDGLVTDAFLSAFLNIKRCEEERESDRIKISLMRGDSLSILSSMASDSFDFIFIDGDHKYAKVKSDLVQAKRLVKKNFSIICGDDLEKIPTPELYEYSKNFLNRDCTRDVDNFHPGVLMAVFEEFPVASIVNKNGFWWVACVNSEFVRLELEARPGQLGATASDEPETEVAAITQMRDDQAILASGYKAERDQAQNQTKQKDARIIQLEAELAERDAHLHLINAEITRAKAQIEMLKDIMIDR